MTHGARQDCLCLSLMTAVQKLIDPFGRKINYLRLSVTDRCNFRCLYCMAEDMTFLPRQQLLCYEEIIQICQVFTELGIEKIRISGGEPLIRSDIVRLTQHLHALPGLKTLAMTTNGSRLRELAAPLYRSGLRRLNISLDTLDPTQFQQLTRTGKLKDVLAGIYAAQDAGFEHIKLNAVILKGRNDQAVNALLDFVLGNGLDISFIEEMPLGHISSHNRASTFYSSNDIREMIEQRYPLIPTLLDTGGPSTYFAIPGHDNRIGFISPHSHNFCASCNRVRMTAEGQLLLCLGNENALDLKDIVRRYPGQSEHLRQKIIDAISYKPKQHDFKTNGDVEIVRFMNMTGG